MEVYITAAENDLNTLATSVSPYLLSFNPATITDEMAVRMGPIYLKQLFLLHRERNELLKELLLTPPGQHTDCGFVDQKALTRVWALASAGLAWDTRPGIYVVVRTLPERL